MIATEIKRSQVEEQVRALQVNAEDLEKICSMLRNKVSSVIRQSIVPIKEGDLSKQPSPPLVPLAQELSYLITQIRQSVDNLRDLNSSIELTERTAGISSCVLL